MGKLRVDEKEYTTTRREAYLWRETVAMLCGQFGFAENAITPRGIAQSFGQLRQLRIILAPRFMREDDGGVQVREA